MNRKMEQYIDSDIQEKNPAMLALNAYDNIINKIRSSNLNFQLQMSPFSAQISLKRSLVRDRSGAFCFPPESHAVSNPCSESSAAAIDEKNIRLQNSLDNLSAKYASKAEECEKAYSQIKSLELDKTIIKKETDYEILVDHLKNEVKKLLVDNANYEEKVKNKKKRLLS